PGIGGTGARPRAHHGRLRRELHRRGHRAGEVRAPGRRRLPAAGGPLLQQAHAGRPVPAFQGHRRSGGRPADGAVQRAGPHGGGPAARHRAAPGAGARHRRHQGSHRQPRAGPVAPARCAARLLGLLGRRPDRRGADAVRRTRQRERHGQRRAAADAPALRGGPEGRQPRRDGNPEPPDAAAPAPVRRGQSDPAQVGDGPHGPVRPGAAAADDTAFACVPRAGRGGIAFGRPTRL
ncbi:MAG: 4-hydroxy-tetrahydrodipicolinate synthase, partial [uncultured Ramlibacter sp.]